LEEDKDAVDCIGEARRAFVGTALLIVEGAAAGLRSLLLPPLPERAFRLLAKLLPNVDFLPCMAL
jgi:hypothetical protein